MLAELLSCSRSGPQTSLQLHTAGSIAFQPAPDRSSRFAGADDATGAPILVPRGWARSPNLSVGKPGRGAQLLAVGDTCEVVVDVVSSLPGAVQVAGASLTLLHLIKVSGRGSLGSTVGSASAALALAGAPPSAERVFSSWSEREEVTVNTLVDARPVVSSSRDAAGVHGEFQADGSCPAASFASNTPEAVASSSTSAPEAAGRLLRGELVLHPGVNRLTFRATPPAEGLYVLKNLKARVGTSLELLVSLNGQNQGGGGGSGGSGPMRHRLGELRPGKTWRMLVH